MSSQSEPFKRKIFFLSLSFYLASVGRKKNWRWLSRIARDGSIPLALWRHHHGRVNKKKRKRRGEGIWENTDESHWWREAAIFQTPQPRRERGNNESSLHLLWMINKNSLIINLASAPESTILKIISRRSSSFPPIPVHRRFMPTDGRRRVRDVRSDRLFHPFWASSLLLPMCCACRPSVLQQSSRISVYTWSLRCRLSSEQPLREETR